MSKSALNAVTFPSVVNNFAKSNGEFGGFATVGPSLTRQEFADECDINTLMKRYEGHVIGGPGNLPPMDPSAMYVDLDEMPQTLLEYMAYMDKAQAAFMSLPAVVRKEFDNSAHLFVDYAMDPNNIDQMRAWGLAAPKAPDVPAPAQASPPSGSPGPAPASAPAPSSSASAPPAHGST